MANPRGLYATYLDRKAFILYMTPARILGPDELPVERTKKGRKKKPV